MVLQEEEEEEEDSGLLFSTKRSQSITRFYTSSMFSRSPGDLSGLLSNICAAAKSEFDYL